MYLDRLLSVLEAVAASGQPASVADIQHTTGLPKPTCYRLIQELVRHQLLAAGAEKGRYVVAGRLRRLAVMGQLDTDIRQTASPLLQDAVSDHGAAFFLSRLRGTGVEIIHVETPNDPAVSFVHPGLGYRPLHACSCSKVITAFSDGEFQAAVLGGALKAYTPRTMTHPDELAADLQAIRARGYAECIEEIDVGISSVAAPVLIDGLGAPFSLGATGSLRQFSSDRRQQLGTALIAISAEFGQRLQRAPANAPPAEGPASSGAIG